MFKILARQALDDIRSGLGDDELMARYQLSRIELQRLMQSLVQENVIEHEELYERSPTYREIVDGLSSRHFPRVSVPAALRIYNHETSQTGFVRDIWENGVRVAGIDATVGQTMTLDLPLKELVEAEPLQFEAECRWSKKEGRDRKYLTSGFAITNIASEAQSRLRELIGVFRSQIQGEEPSSGPAFNMPELMKSVAELSAEIEPWQFSGRVEGVDILDFLQFMLLTGKKTLITVESPGEDECQLHLDGGRIVHAVQGELEGKPAFFACMSFPGGEFSTEPWSEPDEQTIDEPGEYLLVEAARRRDESSDKS